MMSGSGEEIDWAAVEYLRAHWPDRDTMPTQLVPLQTTGDGNCAIHAVSRGIWGVELFHGVLREGLYDELRTHATWYRGILGEADGSEAAWAKLLAHASKEGEQLEFAHMFALANVIKRPIVVLASVEDELQYGQGENSATATFLPLRHRPTDCVARLPVTIAWSNKTKHHFVPVVWYDDDQQTTKTSEQQ
jgi:hypothetical protein